MQINQENDWISSHHKSWRWPFTIPRHVCVGFSLTCSVSIRGEKSCDKERYLRTWFDLSFFCPITRLICRIHGLTARTVSLYWISRYLNSRLSAYLAYWAYIPRWDQPHVTPSPSPSSPSNALSSLTVSLSLYVTISKGFSADAGDNFSAPLIIMISTFDPGGWKPVSLSSTPPARFFSFSSFFFLFYIAGQIFLSLSPRPSPRPEILLSLFPFFLHHSYSYIVISTSLAWFLVEFSIWYHPPCRGSQSFAPRASRISLTTSRLWLRCRN